MWMVDSNDHGKDLKMATDPVYGRKLRPLIPRPVTKHTPFPAISTPPCCCIQNPNILQWNHPISGLSDSGSVKKDRERVPLLSTRWNPTPEQLQALEEMYRRGITTPSAEQIQQIAAKLRRFGRIEGKNVFYWFQNHKARERQKKRRQLELLAGKNARHAHTTDTKPTGLCRKYIDIEHHQKLPTPSNCSSSPLEDSASMQAAAVIAPECGKDVHKISTAKNESRWQLDLSSSGLSPDNASVINTVTALKATARQATSSSALLNLGILLPTKNNDEMIKAKQTLDLFPIGSIGLTAVNAALEEQAGVASTMEAKFTPNAFIEFLPTKN